MNGLVNKAIYTFKNFKNTAYHHYGKNYFSILRMVYNGFFRINTFVIYEKILDDSVIPITLNPMYKIIKPTLEELNSIRKNRELPREFYYDQFHGVKNCYVVLYKDQPVYIHWVYKKGDPNRFLKLDEDVGEFNYNTTLPEFRGQKLMEKAIIYMMNDLKNDGFKKVVGVVNILNPAATKSVIAVGFKEVRKIKTIGYFNKKYTISKL